MEDLTIQEAERIANQMEYFLVETRKIFEEAKKEIFRNPEAAGLRIVKDPTKLN